MPKNAESNTNPRAAAGSGSSSSSTSAPPLPWIELPKDLTLNIFRRLNQVEILESVQYVCTTWRNLCCEPSLWRFIDLNHHSVYYAMVWRRDVDRSKGELNTFYDVLCCRAVDRSQGELIGITVMHFGSDELLRYISDRSSHLKSLVLDYCDLISPEGLMAAIKNFPLLEELHLLYAESDFDFDMEAIGVTCPLLKSFSFNKNCHKFPGLEANDSEALSIAKNMPNLCRLSLVANCLSNQGLQAILDGCLNLQSLDVRLCFHVDLESDFGRRCSERIKELKWGPDYESDDDDDDHYAYDDDDDDDDDDDEDDEDDDDVYADEEDDCYNDGNSSDEDF